MTPRHFHIKRTSDQWYYVGKLPNELNELVPTFAPLVKEAREFHDEGIARNVAGWLASEWEEYVDVVPSEVVEPA